MSESPYLTVPEVARLARCGHNAVRDAIAAGELRAFMPRQKWLIAEQDARAWVEARPAQRRPASAAERPRPARRARTQTGSVQRLRELERQAPPRHTA